MRANTTLFWGFVASLSVAAAVRAQTDVCPGPQITLPIVCSANLQPNLMCYPPQKIDGNLTSLDLYVDQRASDIFSWETFVGLSWPALAGSRGQPDPKKKLSDPGERVWETWKETSEVFRHAPDNKNVPVRPDQWSAPPPPPPAQCAGVSRVMYRTSKVFDVLDSSVQPTGAVANLEPTLTAINRRQVRYEIRMNKKAFDFIMDTDLWNSNVQNGTNAVNFPPGSALIKAAWVPMEGLAVPTDQFLIADACVCDMDKDDKLQNCGVRKMGLVGFHVMSKVPNAPQWIWSTFENANNVSGSWPIFNRFCSEKECPPNVETKPPTPNQIFRVTPIPSSNPVCGNRNDASDNVSQLNLDMHDPAQMPAPYRFYNLINTQWPRTASSPDFTVFDVIPSILANTTLESFIQPTSSCMGCHAMARTNRPEKFVSANFTFSLNDAYPSLKDTRILPPPDGCDPNVPDPSNPVCNGQYYTLHTYETLPQYAKAWLHCGSCHLDAGRNPNSAWWVGVYDKWQKQYAGEGGISKRINQCFKKSLNGKALCDKPDNQTGLCPTSEPMTALIDYMRALDAEAAKLHITPPASPYPPLKSALGRIDKGAAIFQQKCAFCHNADGQGRYGNDQYYRPALWGPNSFNTKAGMDSTTDLAPFIHGNMPFGSGGELTAQETWDLACFIDQGKGHDRPVGSGDRNPTYDPSPKPLCVAASGH
ncbi:MAG: c-type cytochrome [Nevskia sp.]|nr:c-type cytochrome [Nevskia sp.]